MTSQNDTSSTNCEEVPPWWSPSPSATSRTSRSSSSSSSVFSSPVPPSTPGNPKVSSLPTLTNNNNNNNGGTFFSPTQPSSSAKQQNKPVITPNKLKMDTVADSGAVPLWFQYTFPSNSSHSKKKKKSTTTDEETNDDDDESPKKLYKHSLSGERRGYRPRRDDDGGEETEGRTRVDDSNSGIVDPNRTSRNRNGCEVSTTRKASSSSSPSRTTPKIAAAFLRKVEKSLERDLRQCARTVPSMNVIQSVKGRWPPKPQLETDGSVSKSKSSEPSDSSDGIPYQASPVTKEIIHKLDSSDTSAAVLTEQRVNLSSEDNVVFDDGETTLEQQKPLDECSLPSVPPTATRNSCTTYKTPNSAFLNNTSKLSSSIRTQNLLRSSYKIQYVQNKREDPRPSYDDGGTIPVIDSSTSNATAVQHRQTPEDDHRFDVDASADVSLAIPGSARGPEDSKGRFDVSHCGNDVAPRCFYSTGHDHRFDPVGTSDTMVPPQRPGHDFEDEEEKEDKNHEYIPTIWQTRMKLDGSSQANASKQRRRWRLKRVWESSRDHTIVVSNKHEPDYIVEEKDLESALRTLLGVVSYDSSSSSTVSDLSSNGEGSQDNRQWVDHYRDIAPTSKDRQCFRVQRIWDDGEHVVKTEAGKSLNGPALLKSFENDNSESFVWDYSSRQLVPSSDRYASDESAGEQSIMSSITEFLDSNLSEWSIPLHEDSTNGYCHSHRTAHDTPFDRETGSLRSSDSFKEEEELGDLSVCSEDASVVDGDALDDEEFTTSLGSLGNEGLDDDDTKSYTGLDLVESESEPHSIGSDQSSSNMHSVDSGQEGKLNQVKVLRKQLQDVEHAINNIRHNHDMTSDETMTMYKELRSKCTEYLGEISHHLSECEEIDSYTTLRDSQIPSMQGFNEEMENNCGDDESADSMSKIHGRDRELVKRKLRKTERLISRMIVKHGDMARTRALYIQLYEKRAKYLRELGLNHEPFNYNYLPCSYQFDEDDLTYANEKASMISLLDKTLDVIEEGDDDRSLEGSACSAVDEPRCRKLLQRKRRKVVQKMTEIIAERGPKARTRSKLFRLYEAKLFQYCYELGESPNSFHYGEEQQVPSSSLLPDDKSISKLRKGAANAFDVMDSSDSSHGEENGHQENVNHQGYTREQTDFSLCLHKRNDGMEDVYGERSFSPKTHSQSRVHAETKRMRWSPSSATQRVVPSLPKTLALSCDSS